MTNLEKLIHKKISRRKALKYTGKAAALVAAGSVFPLDFFERTVTDRNQSKLFFKPIKASGEDNFLLPENFKYDIIRIWGDKINDNDYYGFNNDFVAYLPINFLSGGKNSSDGLLVVNHEFPSPLFINNYSDEDFKNGKIKSADEVEAEKRSVGISVFRVKHDNDQWQFINDDQYNRRIDANTKFRITGKAAGAREMNFADYAEGTLANCSGAITPWGTLLSAEENYQDYFTSENIWEYRWNDVEKDFTIEHYGWIVEVDPFDKNSIPVKRTSMGRFHHENVAIKISKNGKIAAYMGDDKSNECVYKFVSAKAYDENVRENNFDLLDNGDLYVADFGNKKWKLLDYEKNDVLKKEFSSQADVLVNCQRASKIAGGTECNRPEDIEINPVDGTVFIAFTNNTRKDDYHGSIVRIIEKYDDPESDEFEWEVFATGSVDAGFSCPDNLTFDSDGNLWVLSDISASWLNKEKHKEFKNNSLFMIPTSGEDKGKAFRFATGPVDCEMCGGNFTPDESTMFISIQHPGENSQTIENPTSRWPNFGSDIPRPAVIAITGFKQKSNIKN